MSEPFLGELKMMSFGFAPKGWALCNGQFLPINQNQALFSLFGTTYGGNGQTTFALPDLRSRTPIHFGNGFTLCERAGEENHTITANETPQHTHSLMASNTTATTAVPGTTLALANSANYEAYRPATTPIPLQPTTVGAVGGSQPHNNMQPFLTVSFCVALQGIFPSQN